LKPTDKSQPAAKPATPGKTIVTSLRVESFVWPGSFIGENPFPAFRDRQVTQAVPLDDSLPLELRELIGWQTTARVLPYRMQSRYTRQHTPRVFRSIVLENAQLAATFLPELGGRLRSLFDKQRGRELLACNSVFQPANLAIRDAWFSGGIEWNVGRFGHAALTCSPVFAAEITDWNGDPGLRLYEFERTQGLLWQTDVYLPDESEFLLAHTRVINPFDEPASMYWWTNIAIREAPDVRVLTPADRAIALDTQSNRLSLSDLRVPGAPDRSYPANAIAPGEFFMLTQAADLPWIAALNGQGYGFVEASTPRLSARKLFCWGSGSRGRRWQEQLSLPGETYFEIQAGLAPTQLHGLVMPAQTSRDWTEVFGALEADPDRVHHADWPTAWQGVDAAVKRRISTAQLAELERQCRQQVDAPARQLLHQGSGWGALEAARRSAQREAPFPSAYMFPVSTLGEEQSRWLELLHRGELPSQAADRLPGEWLVQREWRVLLERSLERAENRHWLAWLQLGVMQFEAFDEAGAERAWLESIAHQPSVWAQRNLGTLYALRHQFGAALSHYAQAWELARSLATADRVSLAHEYVQLLHQTQRFDQAAEFYRSLPAEIQRDDRLQILRGQSALALDDLETVDMVLQGEYACVRENETTLADLWYEVTARRLAAETGRSLDDQLRREVRQQRPPYAIDF
jgi:tetratricopeptide (TPR) repeat protein